MKRFPALLALLAVATAALPARAADTVPTAAEIDAAIKKGVEYLYEQQQDGTWEEEKSPKKGDAVADDITGGQWGGQTALCVYALMMAGEKPSDPRMQKAIDFLRTADVKGVYALSMRCQVWLNLPLGKKENKDSLRKDALALLNSVQKDPKQRKGHQMATWDYMLGGTGYSLSRAQYAILAMWAATQAGIDVPVAFWQQVEKTWVAAQTSEGGWTYKHPDDTEYPATVGMTAAGLATLFIAEDFTLAPKFVNANGNPPINPAVTKALQWIVKHWSEEVGTEERQTRVYPFSALYAVERVGLASGLRSFGDIDWYGRGSAWLVSKQRRDGAFSTSTARGSKKGVVDTCFAVLFLARGRVPVAFNKLDYSTGVADAKTATWNQRPREIANLTRFATRELERELRWQIVTLADEDALAESPILYLAGTKDVKFTADAKAKIKRFIDNGGVVLACADGAGKPFTAAVQKLAAELYPLYDFRELPPAHPIYTAQVYQREKWKTKPQIVGMTNGVRELFLVVPAADWGKWWQTQRVEGKEEGWQFGLDLVTYMNDKTLFRPRGVTIAIKPDASAKPTKSIRVALLQYNGNWNPEPQAWPQLTALMGNKGVAKIEALPVKLGAALDGFQFAHLTGTGAVTLDAAAQAALKKFLEAGGTLLVDAAGGAQEFGSSLEAQLPALVAGAKFRKLPLSDKVFSAGEPLKDVAYRAFASRSNEPTIDTRLQALDLAGRPAVVFSKLDLTAGLVGYTIDGIPGYAPDSARALIEKLLLATP